MEKDSMWEVLSMMGSLVLIVLVLVLTYYATRWYARKMGHAGAGKYIKVLDKTTLSAGSSVAVIKVGDRYYLVGTGDKQVNLLSELEDFQEINPQQMTGDASFSKMFKNVMDKVRREDKPDQDHRNGGDDL